MADITNLSSFLGDVADAIRSKKGSEESIPAKNFDEEILSIETGIDTSDADATEENIEEGKTAYVNGLKVTGTLADAGGSADIMVSADNISVGNQRGYDCISTKYTNSGKKIHKDGWYVNQHMKFEDLAPALGVTADKIVVGNTILGVEGIATGGGTVTTEGVKLFETIEEMQDDPTAEEGDLALVYRSEIQNANVDSKFQTANFPATVVLPEAFTDYVDVMYRATDSSIMFECWGELSKTIFRMDCYTETGSINIQYSSEDGITYTRTDGGEETINFGTEIYYAYSEYWNDVIGYFIQCTGSTFEGLYQYTTKQDPNHLALYKMTKQDDGWKGYGSELVSISDGPIHETIRSLLEKTSGKTVSDYDGYKIADNVYRIILSNVNSSNGLSDNRFIFDGTDLYAGISPYSGTFIAYQFDVDLNSNTCTQTQLDVSNLPTLEHGGNTTSYYEKIDTGLAFSTSGRIECVVAYTDASSGAMSWVNTDYEFPIVNVSKYRLAPTQLTLGATNELYPGKIGYGKNGIVTGDGSIWTNRTYSEMMVSDYGADNIMTKNNYTFMKNTLSILNVKDTVKYKYCGLSFTPNENETGYKLKNGRSEYNYIYGDYIFPSSLITTDDGRWELQVLDKYSLEVKHSIFLGKKYNYKIFYANNYMYIVAYEKGYGADWASMNTDIHKLNLDTMTSTTTTLSYANISVVNIDATNNIMKCVGYANASSTEVRLDFFEYNLTTGQTEVNYQTSVSVYDLSNTSNDHIYGDWRMTDKGKMVGYSRYRGNDGVYKYVHLLFDGSSLIMKALPNSYDIMSSVGVIGVNNVLLYEADNWIYGGYRKWNYSTNEVIVLTDTEKETYPIRIVDITNSFGSALYGGKIRIFNDINDASYIEYPVSDADGSALHYMKDNRLEFIGEYGNGTIVYPDFSKKDYTLVYAYVYEPRYEDEKCIYGYKLLMNDFVKVDYTNTISPAEYEEINAMAEDVLGGVE